VDSWAEFSGGRTGGRVGPGEPKKNKDRGEGVH